MARRKSVAKRLSVLERRAVGPRVRTLEAGEFRLVDRAGRTRALLGITRFGPRLAMMHEDGTVALELVLAGDGPGLRLTDEEGQARLFVGATRGTARIGMADREGSQRLFLGLGGGGEPALTLYDRAQRKTWTTRSVKIPATKAGSNRKRAAR